MLKMCFRMLAGLAGATLLLSLAQPAAAFPCYCNGTYLGEYDDVMSCFNDCQPEQLSLKRQLNSQDRAEIWRTTFLQFSDRRHDFTEEQADVLLRAIELADSAFFQERIQGREQVYLRKLFEELGTHFSTSGYLELVGSSQDLGEWLAVNGVVDLNRAEATCVCNSNWDCTSGYVCDSGAECTSAEGSNNNGICVEDGGGGGGINQQ